MTEGILILSDGTLIVHTEKQAEIKRVLVMDEKYCSLFYPDEEPVDEPPVVGVYRDCTNVKWDCEDCKYDCYTANDYPCRMCMGDYFNAFEPKEGWKS